MLITRISPSAYKTHSECPMKYFIGSVLYHRFPSGKAAEKGTMVHAFLEILALEKLAAQNNEDSIEHEVWSEMVTNEEGKEEQKLLPQSAPLTISLEDLWDEVWDYYSGQSINDFVAKDKAEAWKWCNVILDDPEYDPRNLHILQPEEKFRIPVDKPWAKYRHEIGGEVVEGQFAISGIIDLVIEVDEDTVKFIDWKGLPVDTKIPTPNGWTTMGDLKVDDLVYDEEGQQTRVVHKSQLKNRECFKIVFDDGAEVICDDEHLWKLYDGTVIPIGQLKVKDRIRLADKLQVKIGQDDAVNATGFRLDNKYHPYRIVTDIVSVGKMDTQCIEVASETSTYLCTENLIPTHNTGQRKDWTTGKRLEYKDLMEDIQLLMYFYALKKLYPQYKNIIVSIYFTKDGGPYELIFSDHHMDHVEEMLRKKYLDIKETAVPAQKKSWKCRKFCDYGKNSFENAPTETMGGRLDRIGQPLCICQQLHDKIKAKGIHHVTEAYKK